MEEEEEEEEEEKKTFRYKWGGIMSKSVISIVSDAASVCIVSECLFIGPNDHEIF